MAEKTKEEEQEALLDRMIAEFKKVVDASESDLWVALKGVLLSKARDQILGAGTDAQECVAAVACAKFVDEVLATVDDMSQQLGVMEDNRYSAPQPSVPFGGEKVDEIDAAGLIDPGALDEESEEG